MPVIKQLTTSDRAVTIPVVAFDDPNEDWGILSNAAITPIEMDTAFGKQTFPSVEHYFQFMKDPSNKNYLDVILKKDSDGKVITTPEEVRELGEKHFKTLSVDEAVKLQKAWRDGGADDAMANGVNAKLNQHYKKMTEILVRTGNALIVAETGNRPPKKQDGTFGWMSGGEIVKNLVTPPGLPEPGNKLGRLLMTKRNQLFDAMNKPELIVKTKELSEKGRDIMQNTYAGGNLITLNVPGSTAQAADALGPIPDLKFKHDPLSKTLTGGGTTPVPPPPPPPAKNSSVLTASTTSSSSAPKPGGFDDPDKIQKILTALNTQFPSAKWDRMPSPTGVGIGDTRNNKFTVQKDSFTTDDNNVETFKAMLIGFKAINPNVEPKIAISNPQLQAIWEQACKDVGIKAIIVNAATPAPAQNTAAAANAGGAPAPTGAPPAPPAPTGAGAPPAPTGAGAPPAPTGAGAPPAPTGAAGGAPPAPPEPIPTAPPLAPRR
jgi:predicted NAD-dependent protein-ADP-ribosyltransferase YbiA (DUF1768 family)